MTPTLAQPSIHNFSSVSLGIFVVTMMRLFALLSLFAAVGAFAPAQSGRVNTQLSESLFDKIFQMDLFEPVKDQNDYGARNKKNLSTGKLGSNSYIPAGLSKAQYEKVRAADTAKKASNYQKNVAKAGKFLDYTKFYTDRGTDTNQAWYKSATRGHTMAKLKYDVEQANQKKYDGRV